MPRLTFLLVILVIFALSAQVSLAGVANSDQGSSFSTITVNNTADVIANDGSCTLREAVTAANTNTPSGSLPGECIAGSADDMISLPAGQFVLTRVGANEDMNQSGDLDILNSLQIRGVGANQTIIDGNFTDRVIQAVANRVVLQDLAIINGETPSDGFANGGGVAYLGPNSAGVGEFRLHRVVVRNNRASNPQIGHGGDGGGIYMDDGIFILEQSEVSDNWAGAGAVGERDGFGGGIYAGNAVAGSTFRLSTISGNRTPENGGGGGIHLITSNVFFTQMTIANNQVGEGTSGVGGGLVIESSGIQRMKGSIIADNQAGYAPDCVGTYQSDSGNLIGSNTGCFFSATMWDRVNVAAQLDILQDNGGTTRTHALFENSPAIDFGNCDGETTDQRGEPRPLDIPTIPNGFTACEVGAFELQLGDTPTPTTTPTSVPIITVNSTVDVLADDGQCTLREAVTAANTNTASGTVAGECLAGGAGDLIMIPAGEYRLTLDSTSPENDNYAGDLDVLVSGVIIRGAGAGQTIINGNGTDRIFHAGLNALRLTLEDITITNGYVPVNGGQHGGGIFAENGLVLRRVAVRGNRATPTIAQNIGGDGGGVYVRGSFLIEYSEISDNDAHHGGGIYAENAQDDSSKIFMSTISGNFASTGSPSEGGGLRFWNSISRLYTIEATTIANNRVESGRGGAIFSAFSHSTVVLKATILANNYADSGPECYGSLYSGKANIIEDTNECTVTPSDGDQFNIDPMIDIVRDNGGGTRTHGLLDGSPAVDQGFCSGESSDQRGKPRPINHPAIPNGLSSCDVGAFEVQGVPGSPTPTILPTITSTTIPTVTPLPTRTATGSPTPFPVGNIVINSNADVIANDGNCTLREAITAANMDLPSGSATGECAAGNGHDTIVLPEGIYSITLGGVEDNNIQGDFDIKGNLTLLGMDKESTILDGGDLDRVLQVFYGQVTISDVTIQDGFTNQAQNGGGVLVNGGIVSFARVRVSENETGSTSGGNGGNGGGIAQLGGVMTLADSEILLNRTGNGATYPHGSPHGGHGGGVYSAGSLTVYRTTFKNNDTGSGYNHGIGGGLYSDGYLVVEGSTIASNAINGLRIESGILVNTTVSDQDVGIMVAGVVEAKGMTVAFNGQGIRFEGFAGSMTIANSIFDQNGIQCTGTGILRSAGYNSVGSNNNCPIYGDGTGNQIGVDARLLPLADNLGSTLTHALAPNSPARDAGNCFALTTDQRGMSRPSDLPEVPNVADGCDIGAFEVQSVMTPTATPTTFPDATPTGTTTSTPSNGGQILYLPLIRRTTP